MMRTKFLLGAAILGALAFNQAGACAFSAWSATDSVGITAANVGSPPAAGFSRASGLCSLKIDGSATARYVQDNTPTNALTYEARFYINSASADTGAAGFIYLARSATATDVIKIALVGNALRTTVAGGGAVADIPIVAGRLYSVELSWKSGTAQAFQIKVQGNGTAAVTQTTTVTTAAVLKDVRLGLSAAATGSINFDEYDSRRTTAPGRLCKEDANGNNLIQGTDRVTITNEILAVSLATGQADCTENGAVQGTDRVCVTNAILAGTTCP
jgi:hypothetical protein